MIIKTWNGFIPMEDFDIIVKKRGGEHLIFINDERCFVETAFYGKLPEKKFKENLRQEIYENNGGDIRELCINALKKTYNRESNNIIAYYMHGVTSLNWFGGLLACPMKGGAE